MTEKINTDVETTETPEQETVIYTEEEFEKKLQSETDRRVTEAIKKREQALKEEMKAEIERERKEAERLAQLSAEEKEKELLARTKAELEEREKALRHKELLSDTKDILSEKGISTRFAEILVRDNAEDTMELIKLFENEWQKDIEKTVTERLKGTSPRKPSSTVATITKEEFENMSYHEKRELYNTNIDLYRELAK